MKSSRKIGIGHYGKMGAVITKSEIRREWKISENISIMKFVVNYW